METRPSAYRYRAEVLAALAGHGLRPSPHASPGYLRDAVRELYKYEIRHLRDQRVAGRFPKADYARRVLALRERYWLLSRPVEQWLESGSAGTPG